MAMSQRIRRSVHALVIAGLVVSGSLVAAVPAQAAPAATVSGFVTGETAAGWDGQVEVIASYSVFGNVLATTIADPTTGAYSLSIEESVPFKLGFRYTGSGNFLSQYVTTDGSVLTQSFGAKEFPFDSGAVSVDMVLSTGGVVSGTVQAQSGPLVSPSVSAVPSPPPGDGLTTPRVTLNSTTGSYVIDRLPPRTYYVKATSFGSADAQTDVFTVDIDTPRTNVDFSLAPSTGIRGTVTGPDTAYFVSLIKDGIRIADTRTDASGEYQFRGMEPGDYSVKFEETTVDGLLEEWWPNAYEESGAELISVGANQAVSGIDAVLHLASTIGGTITEIWEGTPFPMEAARVTLWKQTAANGDFEVVFEMYPNVQGKYSTGPLLPGTYIVQVDDLSAGNYGRMYWPDSRSFINAGWIELTHSQTFVADVALDNVYPLAYRIAGVDRFDTNARMSRIALHGQTNIGVAYVASGLNYPDALSAGPAAIEAGGALVTVATNSVPNVALSELRRLNPARVVILGGPTTVSTAVEEILEDEFGVVDRIAGANRFETSLRVASDAFDAAPIVFIANGNNFPDALASGPAAGSLGAPVLLVNGGAQSVDDDLIELLDELGTTRAYVLGSSASVSTGILSQLNGYLDDGAQRISGPDRYATAVAINSRFFGESEIALLSTGVNFPDALGGGVLAHAWDAPLYLTPPTCLTEGVLVDMLDRGVQEVYLLGGPTTVADSVVTGPLC